MSKLPHGRPSAKIKTLHLNLKNLQLHFGTTLCTQVMECVVRVYVDTAPKDGSKLRILQIWTDRVIKFGDEHCSVVCTVPHRSDLTDFLPDSVIETLEIYVEQMLRHKPEEFKELNYKTAMGKRYMKFLDTDVYYKDDE